MPPVKMRGTQRPRNVLRTILRLASYMGKFRFLWPLVFLCVLLSAGADVLGTYLLKPALNDYIVPFIGTGSADLRAFALLVAFMFSVYALGVLASFCSSRLLLRISTSTLCAIRKDLFAHVEHLPLRYHDSRSHGITMSLFTNDTDTLRDMFSQSVPQLFSSVFQVVGVFFMMLFLSVPLTVLMLATIFLIMLLAARLGKLSGAAFRRQQANIGSVNGFIEELIEGQRVVKVFTREGRANEQFDALNDELCRAGTSANTYASILGPVMNNLSHLQYALSAIFGAFLVISGKSDIGSVAAFLQSTRSFSRPLSQMSQQFNSILNALAGAERIFAAMDEEVEGDGGDVELVLNPPGSESEWSWKSGELRKPLRGEVVFDGVDFGYVPGVSVLHSISIHALPGRKVAFVGSTGSGKTTIANLLTRFYDIGENSGSITYDGIPISDISKDSLRKSLGMVLQDTHLFSGTIFENIRYGNLGAGMEEVVEAARLANAHSFIKKLPNGYDTVITGDGGSLSQGQRQLLSIARAACANPPVLILDEATSSVDTRTERLIQRGMDSLMMGRTVFVIAHRLSTVRNSDEIIVLERGRIIERGSHDRLMELRGKYWQLYTGALLLE